MTQIRIIHSKLKLSCVSTQPTVSCACVNFNDKCSSGHDIIHFFGSHSNLFYLLILSLVVRASCPLFDNNISILPTSCKLGSETLPLLNFEPVKSAYNLIWKILISNDSIQVDMIPITILNRLTCIIKLNTFNPIFLIIRLDKSSC